MKLEPNGYPHLRVVSVVLICTMLVVYGQPGFAITPVSRNNAQLLGQIPSSSRFIVRDRAGLAGLNLTCLLLSCSILEQIADPAGQLFVVQNTGILSPIVFL